MKTKYKWSLVVGFIAVLMGLTWYGYSQLGNNAPAHLLIEPGEFDFGTVNAKTETTFVMRNQGGKPLEVLGISTSCGCTSAWADQKTILPGGRTTLYVSFDPTVHEDIEGEVFRQVYVRSNDPEQPEVTVDIKATLNSAQGTLP